MRARLIPIAGVLLASLAASCYYELPNRPRPAKQKRDDAEAIARREREEERLAREAKLRDIPCEDGKGNCDRDADNGCEADLRSTSHCGRCNNECPPSQSCEAGRCVKPAPSPPPTAVAGKRAKGATWLSVGHRQACAVVADGKVACWGARDGDPSELSGITRVSAGYPNACAITDDAHVRCWGTNVYGALGDGTIDRAKGTVQVADLADVTALGVGWMSTCAVRKNGDVLCWGSNQKGALGDGTSVTHRTPTRVRLDRPAVDVTGGEHFFCARLVGGGVRCWGDGSVGVLGDGAPPREERKPTSPKGLSSVVALAAGRHHVCAAKEDGHVWCWGLRGGGVLGPRPAAAGGAGARQAAAGGTDTPAEVPDLDGVVELAAGETLSCARRRNGEVWCWGDVPVPMPGRERKASSRDPRPVPQLEGAVQIGVSADTICARRADGDVECIGK